MEKKEVFLQLLHFTERLGCVFNQLAHKPRQRQAESDVQHAQDGVEKRGENVGEARHAFQHGTHFSTYKCLFCDGYHIGKNRDNKVKKTDIKNDEQ